MQRIDILVENQIVLLLLLVCVLWTGGHENEISGPHSCQSGKPARARASRDNVIRVLNKLASNLNKPRIFLNKQAARFCAQAIKSTIFVF